MMSISGTSIIQGVIFKNIDLYEYFLLTRFLEPEAIESMIARRPVRTIVDQYLNGALPLVVAVIYLSHEIRDQPDLLGSMYSFAPARNISRIYLGRHEIIGRELGFYCGEVVKQLSRYVIYRKRKQVANAYSQDDKLPGMIDFPRPFQDRGGLHEWMNEVGLYCKPPDYASPWRAAADYPEYLRYWMIVNFENYLKIQSQEDLISGIERRLSDEDELDICYELEPALNVDTPFLDNHMRVSLIREAVSMRRRKLVEIK